MQGTLAKGILKSGSQLKLKSNKGSFDMFFHIFFMTVVNCQAQDLTKKEAVYRSIVTKKDCEGLCIKL